MKHTGRLPSVLLALCLALGVAAWSAQGARAEASGVDYVGADGRTYNTATDGIAGNDAPTPITGRETGSLPAGWYVVDKTLEYKECNDGITDKRLKFAGAGVHLILADGCTLTAPGIHCLGSLTIYGQAGGTGTIVSSCPNNHGVNANGSLTIHGGAITATSSEDKGICCVSFRMTGGRVTVQGGTGGISGTGRAEIGFRTADDFLSLKTTAGAVFYNFASVTIADGQVMTDGTNFYTDTERLDSDQITALNRKTLRLVEEQCEARIGDTKYAAVQTALNAAAADQTVTLLRDVTTVATLTVPAGADVTLDLNDHWVRYTGTGSSPVITLDGGALTLDDRAQEKTARFVTLDETGRATYVAESGEAGDGCLAVTGGLIDGGTGHYDSYAVSGGGVYVDEGSTFTMNGGTICGNAVNLGGGVYNYYGTFNMEGGTICCNTANEGAGGGVYSEYGTLNMEGGTICGNAATDAGGGVYSYYSTFNMTAGTISGNAANGDGGGVCVHDRSFTMSGTASITGNSATGDGGGVYVIYADTTFNMIGGTISGNSAGGDGGGVYVEGAFNLSGAPAVSGNTDTDGTRASNVYLCDDKSITVTGALTDGAELWVDAESGAVVARGGRLSESGDDYVLTDADAARFHCDRGNGSLVGALDKDNGAAVVRLLTPWAALQARFDNASTNADAPTEITLAAGVTAGEDDEALVVPTGRYATLDLNGHAIDRGLADKDAADNGSVITVRGTLTLTDGSQGKTGTLTGGNTARDGGGVFVDNGGTFRMSGGAITGCTASNYSGGGVYVETNGAFTMEGGTISGNAASYGGGVFVDMNAIEFTMSGGVITGNNADDGGGVYCYACSITVGGSAVISGNVKGGAKGENGLYAGGTASNANLDTTIDGVIIPIIVGSPLTGGAHIGVTVPSSVAAGAFTSGWSTHMSGAHPAAYFTSDLAERFILLDGDGEAVSAEPILCSDGDIIAPAGSVLVLAVYDGTGRLDFVRSATLDRDCVGASAETLLALEPGCLNTPGSYKLMLLDGKTYAPLCEAAPDDEIGE